MKLINDFFSVLESSENESRFHTTISLNPGHIVYTGHFPGYPVTPGVIQLQIVHELLEKHFESKLKLLSMPRCKFLKVLNPGETSRFDVHIEFNKKDEQLNIKAWGENGVDTFFKLNSIYQFIS